jgi:CheY-like chemotaxis protein
MEKKPFQILIVEDNDGDVVLMTEALKNAKSKGEITFVRDGVEAIEFLQGIGKYASAPKPDLILLDLNMPRKSGREVISEIKAMPGVNLTPIIVMSCSKAKDDVLQAYMLGANCYVVKPIDLDGLLKVIKSIEDFWLSAVRFPTNF